MCYNLAIDIVNEVKTNISLANMKLKHEDELDKRINVKLNYKMYWFLMMPSIATKLQYVNSFLVLFSFSLTTCFGPYGPSSAEIYN
jgi:hypothetical protein